MIALINKKQVFKLPLFRKLNCPLADTYSYADRQSLQGLPVTPTFASPVQWYKAEGLAVSRPLSEASTTKRGNSGLNIQIDSIEFGGSRMEQNCHRIFFYTLFLYSRYFPEFIGQFLQPPDFDHRQAEPCLARPLCGLVSNIFLIFFMGSEVCLERCDSYDKFGYLEEKNQTVLF